MQSTNKIGQALRDLRKAHGQSLPQLSDAINVGRAYLNRVELGQVKPSRKLLDQIFVHFSVEGNQALSLLQLAGLAPMGVIVDNGGKEVKMQNTPVTNAPQPQVSYNPAATPVMYTDSTFVTSTEYGLVLDVAQTIAGQQHNVVARIGMSFDHAKKLIEIMQDNIDKNER